MKLKEGSFTSKYPMLTARPIIKKLNKNEPILYINLFADLMREIEELNASLNSIHDHYKLITDGTCSLSSDIIEEKKSFEQLYLQEQQLRRTREADAAKNDIFKDYNAAQEEVRFY